MMSEALDERLRRALSAEASTGDPVAAERALAACRRAALGPRARTRRFATAAAPALGIAAVGALLFAAVPRGGSDTSPAAGDTTAGSSDAPGVGLNALPEQYLKTAAEANGVQPGTAVLATVTPTDRAWTATAVAGDRRLQCLIIEATAAPGASGSVYGTACDPPGTTSRGFGVMTPDGNGFKVVFGTVPQGTTRVVLNAGKADEHVAEVTSGVALARVPNDEVPKEATVTGPDGTTRIKVLG